MGWLFGDKVVGWQDVPANRKQSRRQQRHTKKFRELTRAQQAELKGRVSGNARKRMETGEADNDRFTYVEEVDERGRTRVRFV